MHGEEHKLFRVFLVIKTIGACLLTWKVNMMQKFLAAFYLFWHNRLHTQKLWQEDDGMQVKAKVKNDENQQTSYNYNPFEEKLVKRKLQLWFLWHLRAVNNETLV